MLLLLEKLIPDHLKFSAVLFCVLYLLSSLKVMLEIYKYFICLARLIE